MWRDRSRSPSEIAAVNGDIVALRHHETWLLPEISRKVFQERLDRSGAVQNLQVVLLIVIAEQAVENGGISIDENSLDPARTSALLVFMSDPFDRLLGKRRLIEKVNR